MASRRETQKRKAKVMVVDDDPGLLRLLTIRLRAENYEVEPVASGPAALESAARQARDLSLAGRWSIACRSLRSQTRTRAFRGGRDS